MYIWNIRALKQELVAKTLTESQVFAYFVTMLTLDTLVFQLPPLFPNSGDTNVWDYVGYVGSVIFTVGGAVVAYRMNGGKAGSGFLARYFPLMWVLSVRFLVFLLPFFVVAMIPLFYFSEAFFGAEAADEDSTMISMYIVILSWACFLLFYYRLVVHLREVARAG